ncbi:GNAT family N-acetyltransferase [Cellulomonas sp. NPDC058312]|uniref:GNAT family N-acetyltransferase n=1 Tax=Cellulomonas sp. NPDC058312 TaxID=3346441 RepID=UPI0036E90635
MPSPAESARFGVEVHRLTIGPGELRAGELRALVEASAADVLVVRYDVGRQEVPAVLAATSRAVLPAGALTYWETPVRAGRASGSTEVVPSGALDPAVAESVVRDVVRSSFAAYGNHYTADPLLDAAAALAGYEEWATQSLRQDPDDVLVQLLEGVPVGVATVEHADDHVEVLLAGLVPVAQGRGLYGDLLAAVEARAAARGLGRLVISTQVQNVRVQRAWARQGLRPFAAVETVHLVRREALRVGRAPAT